LIHQIIPPFGLLLSAFILFEDFFYKKIRNEIIYSGFAIVFLLFLVSSIVDRSFLPLQVFFIRFIIAGLVSVILWVSKGWSAGDAKLFWVLALCFQIEGISVISIFNEIFIFLVNIFIPVIPVLLISLISDSIKRVRLNKVDVIKTVRELLKGILVAIVMMLISRVIYLNFLSHLPQGRYNLISMLITFFLISSILRILNNVRMYLIGLAILILNIAILYLQYGLNLFAQIYSISTLAVIVVFIRIFYESVLKYLDVEIVEVERLRRGDSLSKDFIAKQQLNSDLIKEEIGDVFMDGLSYEQVQRIKDYLKDKGVRYVEIQRTFSFSVYFFIGYMFTYFTDFENMLIFIRRIIHI
jgi:hypothetical protein